MSKLVLWLLTTPIRSGPRSRPSSAPPLNNDENKFNVKFINIWLLQDFEQTTQSVTCLMRTIILWCRILWVRFKDYLIIRWPHWSRRLFAGTPDQRETFSTESVCSCDVCIQNETGRGLMRQTSAHRREKEMGRGEINRAALGNHRNVPLGGQLQRKN